MEYEAWFCLKKQKTEVTWDLGMVKKRRRKKHRKAKKKKRRHNEVLSLSILNTKKLTTIEEDMQVTSQR